MQLRLAMNCSTGGNSISSVNKFVSFIPHRAILSHSPLPRTERSITYLREQRFWLLVILILFTMFFQGCLRHWRKTSTHTGFSIYSCCPCNYIRGGQGHFLWHHLISQGQRSYGASISNTCMAKSAKQM